MGGTVDKSLSVLTRGRGFVKVVIATRTGVCNAIFVIYLHTPELISMKLSVIHLDFAVNVFTPCSAQIEEKNLKIYFNSF